MNDFSEILSTLDGFLHKNDSASAEKYLLSCLESALESNEGVKEILLRNELMGLYRKMGNRDDALANVEAVLLKIEEMGVANQVGTATTYLNCATVYKAFGFVEKSITLFEKAKYIYERALPADDERLGGLYNNMALTLVDLKRFSQARSLYQKAISIMKNKPLEVAITYLNMANAAEAEKGILDAHSEIEDCLEKAKALLEGCKNRDGYYAFVCEKCASVFGYFGYFLYDEELRLRARRIYEGS